MAKNNLKHDAFIKKILTNPLATQEFLDHYLPADFKALIDLSKITIEKESFVEDDLKRKLSDLLFSIKTINQESAFVYILIEAQVTSDYWIALRLWKYILLLCERHKQNKDKLPLICPMIIYHGAKAYKAPKNLWQLFSNPLQAKKLMTEDYQLIDLQNTSDDTIVQKRHFGMFEYILKHIHQRDMLKLWASLLSLFKASILIDQEKDYIYIRNFLWYTDAKLPEKQQQALEQIIATHLSKEETATIMRTIAQKYIDEGIQYGLTQGMEKGKAEGIEQGIEKGKVEIAKKMLSNGMDLPSIADITGLDETVILTLKT